MENFLFLALLLIKGCGKKKKFVKMVAKNLGKLRFVLFVSLKTLFVEKSGNKGK